MPNIMLSDSDYQAIEREMALELLLLRREKIVYTRRINDLEHENGLLRNALAEKEADDGSSDTLADPVPGDPGRGLPRHIADSEKPSTVADGDFRGGD